MSQLVTKVRQTFKELIKSTKDMTIGRDADVFAEAAFNFDFESVNYGQYPRQVGNFTVQYIVSPKPESGNTAPSVTYDQIIAAFETLKATAFVEAGLILLTYSYEQSDVVVDPTTGSVSLGFSINIRATEKRNS
ncbi:hypothetical protein [Enterobacter hormaechei]|uniref:hypothetical protein n=1 Tax=Enterobacter hormaechei TaxID=158836 RepID=UPI001E366538|nr:hypothetical protein [Enterobacter hormaechei]MCC4525070.1 hypothetical protein [Enterobacter hormaechei]MCC4529155.1 hypothetical protein [Enterobacter hormaechei]MCC4534363.1 hypothetical protein [Enterobacter hormaechei]MCC4538739.1 hypothetical protein [Enterobacter hormaechei]